MKVRVWDLPLRLFHWALAACVTVSIVTGLIGGNAMQYHYWSGYTLIALLVFRLVWGVAGSRHARFWNFVHGPRAIWRYVRGDDPRPEHLRLGHNPLGSLSVLALLTVVALQVISGLFANDEIFNQGPLANYVSDRTSAIFTFYHTTIGQPLIYALVGLHLAAIAYYAIFKRENLVRPMLTGDIDTVAGVTPARDTWGLRLLALVIVAAGGVLAWWVSTLGSVGGY
ncbi:MAG TPA: cytochrome b/b6 domain-containing protein [Thiomonas arsenitoxydans]|jgi:cytochrome b|uniref:cytochrome b/b6 domain-containing protein n=1 Tax=unclassified Thiomonas TaxID=2625466 RepID=UPI0004DBB7CE|nr:MULTISPECIES: cytochrome b/b6 domain-containing protein [unclassified Thiomonas]CQR44335.1 Cytochrome B561 [Thiomonas sp. CB3]HOI64987.1 cytochrome b/b6 domain-containing protein [Thiomonas arsenitoxydans]CDW92786.1 Cytochrome B561 [Thiomonas sp. CB2]VDY05508.1 Cytochrome B561 [Thiomonas sp. Bio17B3]VDY07329.1 Cytochrome B561 [Thiomonas sp. Sup16B3]